MTTLIRNRAASPYLRTHAGNALPPGPLLWKDAHFALRFQRKLKREGECFLWQGRVNERGYGQFKVKGRTMLAHRVDFMLAWGRWPHCDLLLCHSCDNRACCNPEHLREGTPDDNLRDREQRRGYRWKNQFGHG